MKTLNKIILPYVAAGILAGCNNSDEIQPVPIETAEVTTQQTTEPEIPKKPDPEPRKIDRLRELGTVYETTPDYVVIGTDKAELIEDLIRGVVELYSGERLSQNQVFKMIHSSDPSYGLNTDSNRELNNLDGNIISNIYHSNGIEKLQIPKRVIFYDEFVEVAKTPLPSGPK